MNFSLAILIPILLFCSIIGIAQERNDLDKVSYPYRDEKQRIPPGPSETNKQGEKALEAERKSERKEKRREKRASRKAAKALKKATKAKYKGRLKRHKEDKVKERIIQ